MVSRVGRIVSSPPFGRNTQGKNVNAFKVLKIGTQIAAKRRGAGGSGLLTRRREQVAAATDGADYRRLGRVRFDLAADAHDAKVDGTVEGLAVAGIGELQQ